MDRNSETSSLDQRATTEPATNDDRLLSVLQRTVVTLVQSQVSDLTARQLAIFLVCYLEKEMQTVGALSAALRVPKPAITRALNRLEELRLVRRRGDPKDRRSSLITLTSGGHAFRRKLASVMADTLRGS
jgi:DNA-binding MarR family transcriptional regulator